MKNENMKNYSKLIEGQLQICEAKKDENLQKQMLEYLNFEKAQLHQESLEEIYYDVFVDKFLVRLIEGKIKEINNRDDLVNEFKVEIEFSHYKDLHNGYLYASPSRAHICLVEPKSLKFYLNNKDNMYILGHFKELYTLICKNVSVYKDISIDFDKALILSDKENTYFFLSFECTLDDLINMYYMEKQRQEYESYDAREEKIKQK